MSILSILDPACTTTDRAHHLPLTSAGNLPTTVGADLLVPLADGRVTDYANLDHGASAPCLEAVRRAVDAALPSYASVHRGNGYASRITTQWYERARAEVHSFVGARPDDQVVFTRQTTDALNLLARCLPQATTVVVFETEHHAALLPWQAAGARITVLDAPRTHDQAVRTLERALAGRDGTDAPALVCVTGASNVTGELWPVRELARTAHAHRARIVLDAAQLAPHRPVSVGDLDVDWVAFSGHKLYAPFGSGVLAGRADWLDGATPYLAGGGATRTVARRADGGVDAEWHRGPARHEAGSPNVIGAHAVASACGALTEAGFGSLVARERRLTELLTAGLAELPGVRVLSLFGDDAPRVGVVSFVADGWDSARLAAELSARYGIGVRDGLFCAHPLVRALLGDVPAGGCDVPGAGPDGRPLTAVRASFGVGTPDEHVERLLRALRELTGGPGGA
jgi:selenocysteine lyase/cysteine desulfurase